MVLTSNARFPGEMLASNTFSSVPASGNGHVVSPALVFIASQVEIFAKSLSLGLNIPLIAINHMKAHVLAHFIDEEGFDKPTFPFIALTISGGHTQIIKVSSFFDLEKSR